MGAMRAAVWLAVAAAFVTRWAVPTAPQLDHLVVAIRSLDEGIAQFQALTGVTAGIGGKHPGRGTENALVSLGGGSYLEIIAPQKDAKLSGEDARMRGLAQLTIIDWAVRIIDVDDALASLRRAGFTTSPPQPGARLTPSGERLDWMTFGLAGAPIDSAPFFIRWSPNTRHPSTTAPGGCALGRLVVHDPQSDRLTAALGALDVPGVTVAVGTAKIEAALTCGSTHAVLTSR
jgi:hypothetical protein